MARRTHFPVDIFLICLLSASLFMVLNAEHDHINEKEVEDEHLFNYEGNTSRGPDNWGNLKPEWRTCDSGKLQSPIDLLHERVQVLSALGDLKRTYKLAPAVMKNRGHDIMVEWEGDAGGVVINGTVYKLLQCHWHTPSEHTIDGKNFKMELHMVHTNAQGEVAVVGILYTLGRPDSFLDKLVGYLGSIEAAEIHGKEIDLGSLNPWEIKFGSRKYSRYLGSLTVPPCTEGVIWTLLKKVRTVSIEQLRALKKAVNDGFEENARPTQPLDGRSIYSHRPNNA